jgi:hypothetical protein
VSVEVVPDFDGDGLSDAYEQTYAILDWWNGEDAGEDDDGDDLINAAEAEWGTDPTDPDSDGDGVTDGAEVSGGSVPTDGSSVPQPAFLIPSHTFLTFVATDAGSGDLEQLLLLMSNAPRGLDWTAASSAPWLTVEPASGTTPAVLTIRVDAATLRPGLQTAMLTFSGGAEDVIVPVYVTMPGQQIYLPLIAAP